MIAAALLASWVACDAFGTDTKGVAGAGRLSERLRMASGFVGQACTDRTQSSPQHHNQVSGSGAECVASVTCTHNTANATSLLISSRMPYQFISRSVYHAKHMPTMLRYSICCIGWPRGSAKSPPGPHAAAQRAPFLTRPTSRAWRSGAPKSSVALAVAARGRGRALLRHHLPVVSPCSSHAAASMLLLLLALPLRLHALLRYLVRQPQHGRRRILARLHLVAASHHALHSDACGGGVGMGVEVGSLGWVVCVRAMEWGAGRWVRYGQDAVAPAIRVCVLRTQQAPTFSPALPFRSSTSKRARNYRYAQCAAQPRTCLSCALCGKAGHGKRGGGGISQR